MCPLSTGLKYSSCLIDIALNFFVAPCILETLDLLDIQDGGQSS